MLKLNLRRFTVLLLALLYASPAPCQEDVPDHCRDVLLNAAYETTKLKRDDKQIANFEQWFFSDDFETFMRSTSGGISITLPVDGVPVTFGGKSESSDSWTKRKAIRDTKRWTFSSSSFQSLIVSRVNPEALQAWRDCMQRHADASPPKLIHLQLKGNTKTAVSLAASYTHVDGATPPTVSEVVASTGLDFGTARETIVGKPLTTQGEAIMLNWSESARSGLVFVTTNRGSSNVIHLTRPVELTATISYEYLGEPVWVKLDVLKDPKTTPDHHEDKSSGEPRSSDGKYKAGTTAFSLAVKEGGQELRNPQLVPTGGAHEWTRASGPTLSPTKAAVTAIIYNWSKPASFELTAELWGQQATKEQAEKNVQSSNGVFVISIPKGAINPKMSIPLDTKVITFPVGQVPEGRIITLVDQKPVGLETVYEYKFGR